MDITIEELDIPARESGAAWDAFAQAIRLSNEVEAIRYGTPDLAYEPDEELTQFHDAFSPHRLLVAHTEGVLAGVAFFETQVGDDADSAWITVEVLPAFERRGVGTALAEAIENITREADRPKALVYHAARPHNGEQIVPPTGVGSLPAEDRSVRFLLTRGYRLEQVERVSRLPLPVAGLDEMLTQAEAISGPDYVVHTWQGRCPDRWLEDIALMNTRMSTDAPTAGLEEPEDVWTVERVIARDDAAEKNPRARVVAVVEHVPSGHLVGFTVISVPRQVHRAPMQYATLVLREHRGHKLGMLIKAANLAHLERVSPGHPSIITFNAEENRHMLDVNEALGYMPIAVEGAWRKDL
ncbi:MAG: GNAT family N-acetyltransferase [Rhodoglobus sp.]